MFRLFSLISTDFYLQENIAFIKEGRPVLTTWPQDMCFGQTMKWLAGVKMTLREDIQMASIGHHLLSYVFVAKQKE